MIVQVAKTLALSAVDFGQNMLTIETVPLGLKSPENRIIPPLATKVVQIMLANEMQSHADS